MHSNNHIATIRRSPWI